MSKPRAAQLRPLAELRDFARQPIPADSPDEAVILELVEYVLATAFVTRPSTLLAEASLSSPLVQWTLRLRSGQESVIAVSPSVSSFRTALARIAVLCVDSSLYGGGGFCRFKVADAERNALVVFSNSSGHGYWVRVEM